VASRGGRKLAGEKMSQSPEFLCYDANWAEQNIKISSRFSAGLSIFLMEAVFPSLASERRHSAADQERFLTRGANEGL
jgi:hypothetical protein